MMKVIEIKDNVAICVCCRVYCLPGSSLSYYYFLNYMHKELCTGGKYISLGKKRLRFTMHTIKYRFKISNARELYCVVASVIIYIILFG